MVRTTGFRPVNQSSTLCLSTNMLPSSNGLGHLGFQPLDEDSNSSGSTKYIKDERLGSDRLERINEKTKNMGSRKDRKLKKYSNNFNKMFDFYLSLYRSGLITFCGIRVEVEFNVDGSDGKLGFREYDNGRFKNKTPISRHPNILKGVIIGKKGWGLWLNNWSEGIVDWTFTKEEILEEFSKRNIEIPESLMNDWDNRIETLKRKRNLSYLKEINRDVV